MTRRSLRPQLNQIRGWVNQGRTDAWIAHQLEVSVSQIESFKKQYDLQLNEDSAPIDEVDLRAEDDAAIADELEEKEREAEKKRAEEAREAEEKRKAEEKHKAEESAKVEEEKSAEKKPRRTRTRRRKSAKTFEGTFDHGDEGYGLWLDPAVEDNATYAEHWAGHRPVEVTIEEDRIVIKRV